MRVGCHQRTPPLARPAQVVDRGGVAAVRVDRVLVRDQAARLQVGERVEQVRAVGHATALIELAAVAGDDAVADRENFPGNALF